MFIAPVLLHFGPPSTKSAVATVAVANTWTDIVDIGGAGFLGNVIPSRNYFNGSKTVGIRITVDGEQWEWLETIVTAGHQHTRAWLAQSPIAVSGESTFAYNSRLTEMADAIAFDNAT
ncbi:MAG: hypothetical protein R3E64_03960 [Halioglobus sp.]